MEAREDRFQSQLDLDPDRVVFLGETTAATHMRGTMVSSVKCTAQVISGLVRGPFS